MQTQAPILRQAGIRRRPRQNIRESVEVKGSLVRTAQGTLKLRRAAPCLGFGEISA